MLWKRSESHSEPLAKRYRGRTDTASLHKYAEERRRVGAEYGTSRLGCLPVLLGCPSGSRSTT